jgi:hypothetical protein
MGAVITFPEVRRGLREAPMQVPGVSAAVVILPVVRIERQHEAPSGTETTKSPSGRKRRPRASRP